MEISRILDENPIIIKWVLQDLVGDKNLIDTGAEGMAAEQVFRSAIVKQSISESQDHRHITRH